MDKVCRTCCLSDKIKNLCCRTGTSINLDEDYCSKHAENLLTCDLCGNFFIGNAYLEQTEDGTWYSYCGKCNSILKTCGGCQKGNECEFDTNPDPMPKVVMKTVSQGNMMMQSQVRNEERVKKYCHSCHCWDEEHGCMKIFNVGCDKKQYILTSRNP